MPDTPENRAHFGGQSGRKGNESGYPLARIVALMVLRSHVLAGAWFGPYGGTNELDPAKELLEREETIRSKTKEGVEQELWGLLLAYNLVRVEMERIAKGARVEPTRISFVESLRLIRDEWAWLSVTSPGAIPKRLATMRANIKR